MNILSIALNTFREAVRDKILYVLICFGLIIILISRAVGWISYGGQLKVMTGLGLFSIWLFSALIAIFIGTGMIYKEIDKRTLYTILSKPIHRWEFVLGKYAGLLLTTSVNLVALSLVFLAYLKFMRAPLTWAIAQALALTFIEMMVVTALAVFFSSASTPILSAIFTSLIFGLGQLTKWIVELSSAFRFLPWAEKAIKGLYLLAPNLHNFNVRQEAVLAAGRGQALAIGGNEMFAVVMYGLSYTAALLLAAIFIFGRRNF